MKRIIGHPTADNIFNAIMEVIDKEEEDEKLPIQRLVGLTTDGAAVMISDRGGVYGKMKASVNPKLFSTHCPPHRLILASKAGQKEIPADIEKTVSATLFFFKDSSMRRDEFKSLKDLVEPNIILMLQVFNTTKLDGYLLPIVLVGLLSCYLC